MACLVAFSARFLGRKETKAALSHISSSIEAKSEWRRKPKAHNRDSVVHSAAMFFFSPRRLEQSSPTSPRDKWSVGPFPAQRSGWLVENELDARLQIVFWIS